MLGLVVSVILVALCPAQALHKGKASGAPDLPLHSTCICQPSLCWGSLDSGVFKEAIELRCYCHPSYGQADLRSASIYRKEKWNMAQPVLCKPPGASVAPGGSNLSLPASTPLIAAALVVLSALILAVVLCVLVKPKPTSCSCRSRVYETLEETDSVAVEEPRTNHEEDAPEPLPSYEEAVYGHMGGPLQPGSPRLMPPVLSAQPEQSGYSHVAGGSLEAVGPPPSYQEAMAADCTTPEDAPGSELTAQCALPSWFSLDR